MKRFNLLVVGLLVFSAYISAQPNTTANPFLGKWIQTTIQPGSVFCLIVEEGKAGIIIYAEESIVQENSEVVMGEVACGAYFLNGVLFTGISENSFCVIDSKDRLLFDGQYFTRKID